MFSFQRIYKNTFSFLTLLALFLFCGNEVYAHLGHHNTYKIGSKVHNFRLLNIDSSIYSLDNFAKDKGIIVVFTCNHCPYAKAYVQRILDLDQKFKPLGYPVLAINPNDPSLEPTDDFPSMQKIARDGNYTFPYLFDEKQEVYPLFGATRTPHIFVLQKQGDDFVVKYIGAIDDNYKEPSKVTKAYVELAVNSLLAGKDPEIQETKAIGCSIKTKANH